MMTNCKVHFYYSIFFILLQLKPYARVDSWRGLFLKIVCIQLTVYWWWDSFFVGILQGYLNTIVLAVPLDGYWDEYLFLYWLPEIWCLEIYCIFLMMVMDFSVEQSWFWGTWLDLSWLRYRSISRHFHSMCCNFDDWNFLEILGKTTLDFWLLLKTLLVKEFLFYRTMLGLGLANVE